MSRRGRFQLEWLLPFWARLLEPAVSSSKSQLSGSWRAYCREFIEVLAQRELFSWKQLEPLKGGGDAEDLAWRFTGEVSSQHWTGGIQVLGDTMSSHPLCDCANVAKVGLPC